MTTNEVETEPVFKVQMYASKGGKRLEEYTPDSRYCAEETEPHYIGYAMFLSPAGPTNLRFMIAGAKTLDEALKSFEKEAQKAADEYVKKVMDQQKQIVVPHGPPPGRIVQP